MNNPVRNCPICNSNEFTDLYNNQFEKIGNIDLTYSVSSCLKCGLIYSNYLPGDDVYSEYYSNFSKYDVYDTVDKIPPLDDEVARVTMEFIINSGINARSVYDIGCSIGLLLSKVKANDSKSVCRGIDPSPKSREIAQNLFGIDVEIGFYEGKTSLAEYDLIASCSVLEHIKDVKNFVKNIADNAKTGSYLLFLVPSLNDFPDLDGEWLGELSIEHINYFNEHSVRNVTSAVGYQEVDFKRIKLSNGQFILIYLARLNDQPKPFEIGYEGEGTKSIKQYLQNGEGLVRNIEEKIKVIKEPYILFGAGSHTLRLLKLPEVLRNPPTIIVDSNINIQGKFLGSIKIEAPSNEIFRNGYPVVISSYKGIKSIKSTLRSSGFEGEIVELY